MSVPVRKVMSVVAGAALVAASVAAGALPLSSSPRVTLGPRVAASSASELAPQLGQLLAGASRLGPMPASQVVHLSLGLRGRDGTTLARLLDAGRTVPSEEYAARFGPAPGLVHQVERALAVYGLRTSWSPGNATMDAAGPASAAEHAFSVTLDRYSLTAATRVVMFYAPSSQPTLPPRLGQLVTSVLGLDDFPALSPAASFEPGTQGASSPQAAGGFTPAQVQGLYHFDPLYSPGGLSGSGQTVVFMEISAFLPSDLESYARAFGLPPFDVTGPVTNATWGQADPVNDANWEPETEMDMEIVHAMAPDAQEVVYEAGATQASAPFGYVAEALQSAVDTYPHAVFSISLGWCEDAAQARQLDGIFTQLAASGGTALVSSGDNGAYARGCSEQTPSVEDPGDSPHVTSVGGTAAFIGAGSTYGAEAAWGNPVTQAGTGGGLSAVFPRPSWQVGPGVSNQYSNGMRQVPDVASIGDGLTGWDVMAQGKWMVAAGTSAGAPLWAALIALADQALAERNLRAIGFADPALYDIGANTASFPGKAFHNVTAGNNLYYPATPGWNFATGWGSPDASALVSDLIVYRQANR